MQEDRRFFPRVISKVQANFYVESDNGEPKEFGGIISNLSEVGIKIEITEPEDLEVVNQIVIGDRVSFQAFDEYELYGKTYTDIFRGKASIVRMENSEEGIILGCKVHSASKDFERYINNKRISIYLNTIKRGL